VPSTTAVMCSVLLVASVVVVPPILFLVLLDARVEGALTISWARAFAPLLFLLGLVTLVALVMLTAVAWEHVLAPARRAWGRPGEQTGGGDADGGDEPLRHVIVVD
jgi:hypothetical protein